MSEASRVLLYVVFRLNNILTPVYRLHRPRLYKKFFLNALASFHTMSVIKMEIVPRLIDISSIVPLLPASAIGRDLTQYYKIMSGTGSVLVSKGHHYN